MKGNRTINRRAQLLVQAEAAKEGEVLSPSELRRQQVNFKAALTLSLMRVRGDRTQLQRVADALVRKAVTGNIHAIKEIADRIDGKVVPKMEIEGPDGNLIPTQVAIVFVNGESNDDGE